MKFTDILDLITAGAIVFAAFQIYINRKQLFLSTITKCISDFRSLDELDATTTDKKTLWRYCDLTNEELFYFKHDYLPKKVAIEWIDGMIDFIPVTKGEEVINRNYCIRELFDNRKHHFASFPRIQNAFRVSGNYNVNLIYSRDEAHQEQRMEERRRLINEIMKNNDCFKYFD